MWEHSERKFESRFPHKWDRFGLSLDDTQVQTWKLDPFIRHKPDYVCQVEDGPPFFMEVQGTGKDRKHKFKLEKMAQLAKWNDVHDVWYWLWDDKEQEFCIVSFNDVQLLTRLGKATKGYFDGKKRPYWALTVKQVMEVSDWDSGSRYSG